MSDTTPLDCSASWDCLSSGDTETSVKLSIESLLQVQRHQKEQHDEFCGHKNYGHVCIQIKEGGAYHRRARAHDVNFMLKLGLENANEWGMQFESYSSLSQIEKNLVLAEFGFAYILVDQGFKTANESENDGFWLLQNDAFMHPNYFLALPIEDAKKENAEQKAQLHFEFVNELVKGVSTPFQQLQIDEFECALLKTILLLTPSFPRQVYKDIEPLQNKCMSELMEHSARKFPDRSAERFRELMLLITSIRNCIKVLYNQTRVSDVFHLMTFDPFVRNIFLTPKTCPLLS